MGDLIKRPLLSHLVFVSVSVLVDPPGIPANLIPLRANTIIIAAPCVTVPLELCRADTLAALTDVSLPQYAASRY